MNTQQRAAMQMAYETLERLSCVKQTMHLLWWQIEARKPLSVLREALAQPQGSWVDLTDDEIDELSRTMVKGYKSVNWLSYSIITKFKEKNTPPVVTSNDGYELCEDEGCTHHGTVHYCRSITEGKI